MGTITFASLFRKDGSLTIPGEAVAELGLQPGDAVQVSVESSNIPGSTSEQYQALLQQKFEHFRESLASAPDNTSSPASPVDPARTAFAEAMDRKYRKLGFKE